MRSNSNKKQADKAPQAAPVEQTSDFEKIVQESKNKVQNDEIKDLKRGRGRPSNKAAHDKSSVLKDTQNSSASASPSLTPPPNISGFLIEPLKMISTVPARRYKCPDLAFSQDEAAACANSINEILNAFIPDMSTMSPKTAAILGACVVFGSIGTNKYLIYSSHIEKNKKEIEEQQKVEPQQINDNEKIDAAQAFRKYNNANA